MAAEHNNKVSTWNINVITKNNFSGCFFVSKYCINFCVYDSMELQQNITWNKSSLLATDHCNCLYLYNTIVWILISFHHTKFCSTHFLLSVLFNHYATSKLFQTCQHDHIFHYDIINDCKLKRLKYWFFQNVA